ncbi:urease subunit beta [Sporosarcina ureilytica]|uniref:Urease subunit beta n=1 Tax=Sporosarcina ureilytica TaxID=298596 RepID=A0A1D8JF31_9BACL|nr:urease subunit beta [Sporosarcina ureilytica]
MIIGGKQKVSNNNGYIIPGEYRVAEGEIEINAGRAKTTIRVSNTGDRPIQVGSHIHFVEVNKDLLFDRAETIGKRLNIPSGTAARFEPGEEMEVELTELGGNREVYGISDLTNGSVDNKELILQRARELGYKGVE